MRRIIFSLMVMCLLSAPAIAELDLRKMTFRDAQPTDTLVRTLRGIMTDINTELLAAGGAASNPGTGKTYYVDSAVGANTYTGLTPASATASLDAAVGLCTADRGDTIIVMQGHAETLTAADGVDIDVAGVTVIGLGNGELRPRFTYTVAAGEIVVGADDVTIYNIECLTSVTAVLKAIDIEAGAENCKILGCVFKVDSGGTDEFIDTITIKAASDRTVIDGCLFDNGIASNAGPQASINFLDCDNAVITNNIFFGDAAVAHIQNETTASNFVTIKGNQIFNGIIGGNAGLNTEPCIELVATTTGVISDNYIVCNVGTKAASCVAADAYLFENYYNEDESGAATGGIIGAASADDG